MDFLLNGLDIGGMVKAADEFAVDAMIGFKNNMTDDSRGFKPKKSAYVMEGSGI